MEQRDAGTRQTRPYRPPIGIPQGRENSRLGIVVSVALHVAIALLLLIPFATHVVTPILQGAGGPGPAGGGGGGRGGTGGARLPPSSEKLRFIQVAPEPPPPARSVVPPPQAVVPPKPVEVPRPIPRPEPTPDLSAVTKSEPATAIAPVPGSGGGSGTDGTTGAGPGSGGGTGTGVGAGRGSGVGPGTGGGTQANYPPLPVEMFLPPMPIPERVRGFRMIAQFDVDETGKVVSFKFTETKDGGYNRKLRDVLRSIRFRPGSRPDGTPVRMTAQIEYIL